jgi:fumarylacetoacetase
MLPYLADPDLTSYDVNLFVHLKPTGSEKWVQLCESNMTHLYYSVPQTIAHHSITGCNMATGDLLGTGTISAPEKSGFGSMLELCWKGTQVIDIGDGQERKFLKDGDEVNLEGVCKGAGFTIGFGECTGAVLPAHKD